MAGVRRIVHGSPWRVVGAVSPPNGSDLIEWESTLERDAIYLLVFSPFVKGLRSQPLHLEYWDGTSLRQHTPDLLADTHGGSTLVEVKRQAVLENTKWRTPLVRREAERLGYRYVILKDTVIRREPRLSNVRTLLRYRAIRVPSASVADALDAIASYGFITVSTLLNETGLSLAQMYALVAQHHFFVDLHLPLNLTTIVSRDATNLRSDIYEDLFS